MRVRLPTMRSLKYDDVYGIGDVVAPELGLGMAGVFAHFQGEYVATQILDDAKGAYLGEHYNMSGVCVMDLGYIGAAVYCDFTDVITKKSEWPKCMVIGGARIFRFVKAAFEKQWFAGLFGA
jgi:sulfide:quinone oxidoreductase